MCSVNVSCSILGKASICDKGVHLSLPLVVHANNQWAVCVEALEELKALKLFHSKLTFVEGYFLSHSGL